jgi:hypothetical protein
MQYEADVLLELRRGTPARIVAMIAQLRAIADDAKARIEKEGTVVRTLKGEVIAHPAIKIHADAVKAEAAMVRDFARKMVEIATVRTDTGSTKIRVGPAEGGWSADMVESDQVSDLLEIHEDKEELLNAIEAAFSGSEIDWH